MSIETILTRVAEALEANTQALENLGKPAAAAATKPAAAATKPAAKPSAKTTTRKAATSVDDVTTAVSAYLKTGSKAEREERKGHVKAIIDHYGADRFTNIDPTDFDEALGFLSQFEAGEDPFDGEDAGGEEDGGEESMV